LAIRLEKKKWCHQRGEGGTCTGKQKLIEKNLGATAAARGGAAAQLQLIVFKN